MRRSLLVEAGAALVALGLVLLLAPDLLAYREHFPLAVAALGAAVMCLGAASYFAPAKAAAALRAVSSALLVAGAVLVILGIIGAPLAPLLQPLAPKYAFSTVKEGPIETSVVRIEVDNSIGTTRIVPWDGEGYLVNATVYAGTPFGKRAKALTEQLKPSIEVSRVGNKTVIRVEVRYRVPLQPFVFCEVVVKVPRSVEVELDARTATGEIEVGALSATNASLRATTGRVRLRCLVAERLFAFATTGEVAGSLDASYARLSVTTGRVRVELLGRLSGTYVLRATTGQVDVRVPDDPSVGVRLEAVAALGEVDYPSDWRVLSSGRPPSERLVAETANFSEAPVKITLDVEVTTGQVEVTQG